VLELGCGCGRIAQALRDPRFEGTYVGIDIDNEMLEYCRENSQRDVLGSFLPRIRVRPILHVIYMIHRQPSAILLYPNNCKDFVYAFTLYTHLLEREVTDYLQETYRILRPGGITYMNFLCIQHVELGGRWTFQHRHGNAYVESARYPEAAVAYHEGFMTKLVTNCGFREVTVSPPQGGGQTELVRRK
jgi:SAM-dependent methyltransferase